MPELINSFSWSMRAARDFEECRRKRYWSKYGAWGGWAAAATPVQKAAYRLNKMDSVHSLVGQAVEQAVRWALQESQAGRAAAPEDAYGAVARPFLNAKWKESLSGQWREHPKKFCCLREHYYRELTDPEKQKACTDRMTETVKACIRNFAAHALARLAGVRPEDEVPVTAVGAGDPESFDIDGIKIYAIPDYVYRRAGLFCIVDWKAGKPREEHCRQVALYGLWAHRKHGMAAEQIEATLEYLQTDEHKFLRLAPADLEQVVEDIGLSVADMTDYLVDHDRHRNLPVPKEEWDLVDEPNICHKCNFYEFCKPELSC